MRGIEADFVNWKSPATITEEYGLADRITVYRHAHALGLMAKRNLHAALEKIIEKAGEVEVSASAVVAAIQAYAKINALGQWIERSETVNPNELFEPMTTFSALEKWPASGAGRLDLRRVPHLGQGSMSASGVSGAGRPPRSRASFFP